MGHKATVELVLDCEEPKRLAKFWREALDYHDYYMDAHLAVLVPKEGIASPLLLQGVPEPKSGKNRMHLDIVVDDVETEVHRLQALGAHRIDEGVQSFGGTRWVRMSDPEQNEFCVSTGVEWSGLVPNPSARYMTLLRGSRP
jgi:predicted enzyme related to lactoylglutathione lyase